MESTSTFTFTAVFEKTEGWYVGYVEELPGANRELTERDLAGKNVIREEINV